MRKQENKVDLHGVRHHAARDILIRAIEDSWNSGEELYIITGHSPEMKFIVREVLDEYRLDAIEDDVVNTGYIKAVLD